MVNLNDQNRSATLIQDSSQELFKKKHFHYLCSSPSPPLILHSNPLFLDQQLSPLDQDTVRATQNILSFLQERQFAVNTEVNQTFNEGVINVKEEQSNEQINPYIEGLKCLENHDIANAILFFQMAVQKEPEHIDVG